MLKEIERTCRTKNNGIVIVLPTGETLTFHVSWLSKNRCRFRFGNNKNFTVLREEVHEKIKKEKNSLDDGVISG